MAKVLEIAKNSSTFWLYVIYLYISINGCWLITTNCESVILRTESAMCQGPNKKILSIYVTMSHESANQNNSWSAKLMFRTRLRYEYFGYDCAFTRKLAKPISIFLFRTSRTLLGREHKLLVSFNIANLFLTPRILCIIDDHFILSRILTLG